MPSCPHAPCPADGAQVVAAQDSAGGGAPLFARQCASQPASVAARHAVRLAPLFLTTAMHCVSSRSCCGSAFPCGTARTTSQKTASVVSHSSYWAASVRPLPATVLQHDPTLQRLTLCQPIAPHQPFCRVATLLTCCLAPTGAGRVLTTRKYPVMTTEHACMCRQLHTSFDQISTASYTGGCCISVLIALAGNRMSMTSRTGLRHTCTRACAPLCTASAPLFSSLPLLPNVT